MNTIDLEVEGMNTHSLGKHVTQVLQALTGVSGVAIDRQSGHVRVVGEFPHGSNYIVSSLIEAGYPAHLSTFSMPLSRARTSGGA